jgi:UDP-N-acetylmuramoyl-tripeptide--D-alanyl-D-alanine ligase
VKFTRDELVAATRGRLVAAEAGRPAEAGYASSGPATAPAGVPLAACPPVPSDQHTGGQAASGTRASSTLNTHEASAISTDSRSIRPGETFVALRGERMDGHDYLIAASRRGAGCLVVDRQDRLPTNGSARCAVVVRNTLEALADLGRAARARLTCPVIAVTGSCGKTTVKEMIGQILSPRRRGHTPPASFNNQIGVPLTLLAAEPDDEFVLCELGTNAPGEIAHLAGIARPTVGVVTRVAPVHLEGLGSIEGVAREKAALVEALPPDGAAILNADDEHVLAMAGRSPARRVVRVGTGPEAELRVENVIQTPDMLSFTVGEVGFDLPVLGVHQALQAALAAAAAREAGVSIEQSAEALRTFKAPPLRLARLEAGGVTILNDCFNANPASMQVALDLLALWPDRRKVFFCGDMRELGSYSRQAHESLGRAVAEAGVKRLVVIGPESRATAVEAVAAGLKADAVTAVADAATAAARVASLVRPGDVVLVKGSHALHMERIAKAIADLGIQKSE